MRLILLLAVILAGCSAETKPEPLEPKPVRKEWPQKCEMCGANWLVTPIDNPDEVVPPTVEWCFNDGAYCETGFAMIIEQYKNGESPDLERRWLNHCLTCIGCRCAAFDPDEWRKITDAIREVRAHGQEKVD